MFKRKKTEVPPPTEVIETVAEPRTTCYPKDGEAPPPVLGQPRTTVYRQSLSWNRGGYETVN
jgi:hypothetical protein